MSHALALTSFGVRHTGLVAFLAQAFDVLFNARTLDPRAEAIVAFRDMDEHLLDDLGVTAGEIDLWEKTGIVPDSLKGRVA